MELQDSMKELKAFVDKQMKKDAALKDAAARRAKAPPAGDGNSQVSDAPPLAQDCNMHPMHSPAYDDFIYTLRFISWAGYVKQSL